MRQTSLFGDSKFLAKLSKLGDFLEMLNLLIDWEFFRPILCKYLKKNRKSNAGRPSYDPVMMFKLIVLQRFYNLSDDRMEFRIYDSRTFARFLGLGEADNVPDAKTIWLFKDTLAKENAMEEIFLLFNRKLEELKIIVHNGSIIDATFVDAPKQRNSREENAQIKAGQTPEDWEAQPHKKAQKDVVARWTKKNNENYYGYKNNVKVDQDTKLVTAAVVTPANVHDSQVLEELIDEKDKVVYADKAYAGKKLPEHITNNILEKGCRNKPLTEEQIRNNKEKSRIRVRVEHAFADMTVGLCGLFLRCIGITRAKFFIMLTNVAYNFRRLCFVCPNIGITRV